MRSWAFALWLFALVYGIANALGFLLYRIGEAWMWVGMFTLSPIVWTVGFALYLARAGTTSWPETVRLVTLWIGLSIIADGILYLGVVPMIVSGRVNADFFAEQSPGIWLSYLTIIPIGVLGRWLTRRRDARAPEEIAPTT